MRDHTNYFRSKRALRPCNVGRTAPKISCTTWPTLRHTFEVTSNGDGGKLSSMPSERVAVVGLVATILQTHQTQSTCEGLL